jgi:hypothetical protein
VKLKSVSVRAHMKHLVTMSLMLSVGVAGVCAQQKVRKRKYDVFGNWWG